MHVQMKSKTLPPLRVDPKLRKSIELVLEEGESLSAFMLEAITRQAEVRREQREFVAKALKRSKEAARSGEYVREDVVYKRLERVLDDAKRSASIR